MLRLGIAEADRMPELAAGLYDVLFGITVGDLASHLVAAFGLAADKAEVVANELIGLVIHPTLPRLLFGVEPLVDAMPEETRLAADVDLDEIRHLLRIVMPPPAAA
ncbi:TetR/AcrR family transcriptional regulator C-terminal domain-containing protein [Nocardia sp. NPDC049737]|uniref:TetR/AcrR family transcriptional regulator C-terminal domain-containing protein n=1 Tax=Nocardia sp. NPDC049737 TaxID=3154358 RepID=UPI00342B789C